MVPPPPPAFEIGGLPVRGRVLAAPMCGATKPAYRAMVTRFGADVVYTEMVKADPLVRDDPRTLALLARAPGEENCGPQICGHDEAVLAAAAARLEALGFPLVDLNMGCPVRKVVSQGAGAALLRDPRRVEAVVAACARATRIPITVKLRSGWDHQGHADVVDLVRAAEGGGAALVTVHARVRAQRHQGEVDLDALARAKRAVRVPVVANGGIVDGEGARRMLEVTGCDAVMIGTGAHGRPWLFRDAVRAIAGLEPLPAPGAEERCDLIREHLEGTLAVMGSAGVRLFRKYAGWYFQGDAAADELRRRAYRAGSAEEMRGLIEAWRVHLAGEAAAGALAVG